MKNLNPAIIDGEVVDGYFVCPEGNIWSNKVDVLKKKSATICTSTGYAKVGISTNGKSKTHFTHRIVCATLNPLPVPEGISKKDWRNTPTSVKNLLSGMFQVNHIDHDRSNYHPSNLEWVTAKQNARKYQEHRKSNG